MKQKYLRCSHCGNIVACVHESGVSVEHPMTPEHYIEWISISTKEGNQRKQLLPSDKPVARFALVEGDEVVSAYAYCNLHSLWRQDK